MKIVVIGGGIEDCGSPLLDAIKVTVKEWAVEEASSQVKIIPSALKTKIEKLCKLDIELYNHALKQYSN